MIPLLISGDSPLAMKFRNRKRGHRNDQPFVQVKIGIAGRWTIERLAPGCKTSRHFRIRLQLLNNMVTNHFPAVPIF